jgi:WhiB family transcriptional regulator, redox-sensing transcriptional regulator
VLDNFKKLNWQDEALCAKPENDDVVEYFFSDEPVEKYKAKNLCFQCPIRKDCIKFALESKEIWGIWGGRDENEIRRALSVNADGIEYRRGRYPQCPFCSARTGKLKTYIIDLPNGGRWTTARMVECTECTFKWRSRTSANAVNAYHAEIADKQSRLESKKKTKPKKSKN